MHVRPCFYDTYSVFQDLLFVFDKVYFSEYINKFVFLFENKLCLIGTCIL